jgi:Cu/Ag efflux protein CusF
MLDKVQAGDKVQFKAERPGGALVITEIELRK